MAEEPMYYERVRDGFICLECRQFLDDFPGEPGKLIHPQALIDLHPDDEPTPCKFWDRIVPNPDVFCC